MPAVHRVSRRRACGLAAAAVAAVTGTRAAEVSWLDEIQRPVHPPASGWPDLPPLVPGGAAAPPTWEGWQALRPRVLAAWRDVLGPMPVMEPPRPRSLRREDGDGYSRELVEYDAEPGLPTQAWVLRPAGVSTDRRPAVVALHSTVNETIDGIAGLVPDGSDRALGVHLARRGFVVICPRCFLWQDAAGFDAAVAAFRKRHPDTLGIHKMLHDARRALDLVAGLPEVDPQRVGACGHSLGAKEALYLAAFDDRIRTAVAHDGGIGRGFSNWDAPWYLGRDVPAALDHHQLLALVAPRAFLLQGAGMGPGAADGDRSWPYVAAALPIHRLGREPPRLGLEVHGAGHRLTDHVVERLTEWLTVTLGD